MCLQRVSLFELFKRQRSFIETIDQIKPTTVMKRKGQWRLVPRHQVINAGTFNGIHLHRTDSQGIRKYFS